MQSNSERKFFTLSSLFLILSRSVFCFSVNEPPYSLQSNASKSRSKSSFVMPNSEPLALLSDLKVVDCNSCSDLDFDSCSRVFSRIRSICDGSSSGMRPVVPETTNTRLDLPNVIWSPANTGACMQGFSLRLFTKVPCVDPASNTKHSDVPSRNCNTACKRDDDGCSRTTSLSRARPSRRWVLSLHSMTCITVPPFSTSKEKFVSGKPPQTGSS
mmetsp:Transcript_619/g.1998  ORF Transcript_619/g.1998 Transcript_619/m.1998 type:complete len:214 (+) Transcript_619:4498-5139(+)